MEKTLKFKIIKFVDITIKRQKFHQYKDPFQQAIQMLIKQQYLRRSLLTKINNENFKYFISYKDIKIFLPKMGACRRDFDKTKCMNFLIKDDKILKNIIKFGKK